MRNVRLVESFEMARADPFRGYANGLLSHLGHASVVVDHFHAVRLANQAIDDVRRRVQNHTTGHRGRRGDPLYGIRRLALVAGERLSERGWGRLLAGLAAGDPEGEVGAGILAKELRLLLSCGVRWQTRPAARIRGRQPRLVA